MIWWTLDAVAWIVTADATQANLAGLTALHITLIRFAGIINASLTFGTDHTATTHIATFSVDTVLTERTGDTRTTEYTAALSTKAFRTTFDARTRVVSTGTIAANLTPGTPKFVAITLLRVAGPIDAVLTFGAIDAFAWVNTHAAGCIARTTSRTLDARAERHTCIFDAVLTFRACVIATGGAA